MNRTTRLLIAACLVLQLSSCNKADPAADAERDAAAHAAAETAAGEAEARFNAAVKAEDWRMAKAHADVLLAAHPGTDAADRVQAQFADIKAKADAAKESARLAALWTYNTQAVKSGKQLSASLYSDKPVGTGDGRTSPVRLIFRDHPEWGRSSYLVLESGDFDCRGGCTGAITIDGERKRTLPGSRPDTDEAIAMFIDDEKALWSIVTQADTIAIDVPVKGEGKQPARFEVGGLDAGKLPGWE